LAERIHEPRERAGRSAVEKADQRDRYFPLSPRALCPATSAAVAKVAAAPLQKAASREIRITAGTDRFIMIAVPNPRRPRDHPAHLRNYFDNTFSCVHLPGVNRIFWIHTNIWPAACVDTDPISGRQWLAFARKQATPVVHDALQSREHVTGNEIFVHVATSA
jgi:hypothetical protein